jgi:2'-5' RNA ligase
MKRIFIGSFIDSKGLKKHYTEIKKDFSGVLTGSWVKPENFHITYKFLGNVEDNKIEDIKNNLSECINKEIETQIVVKGLGVFPNLDQPKVLYFKVEENPVLAGINKYVENQMANLGFKREIKRFLPHITIVRIKEVKQQSFLEKIKKYEDKVFFKQKIITVDIIESMLNPKGAVYKKV